MSKLSTYELPNIDGRYGNFGGRFVPELLMPALLELDEAYEKAMQDPIFTKELDYYLQQYVGRETPLYHAKNLSEKLGGPQIYLKREDLNQDRKSTRLNSSHVATSYAVCCLKKITGTVLAA